MTRVGVDTGGTFTDFLVLDESGLRSFKVPSTPTKPAGALLSGISDRALSSVRLLHGTTVGTNAILEGKVARTAFVTTEGFRDILFLARQTRPHLYEFEPELPRPPLSEADCFTLPERMLHTGDAMRAPTPEEVEQVASEVSGYDAVAVCLLFAYANPAHELALAEAIHGPYLSLSHSVSPEFREYERAVATVLNAAIGPRMASYLSEIGAASAVREVLVMSSAGGLSPLAECLAVPISTVTSGPAAGVTAVAALAARCGRPNAISFDMGGTSTDVSLIAGRPSFTDIAEIGGLELRQHRIHVHTIGTGGGSIASLDAAGALRVGPKSAGADPGPAYYGRGGPVTVTDAFVVLGLLPDVPLAGGRGPSGNRTESVRSVSPIASALGLSVESAAEAILRASVSQMAGAVRRVSAEQGFDPASFSLIAFGGAGPLVGCLVAEEVSIREVIVPSVPGVFSAYGLLLAPEVAERSATILGRGIGDPLVQWQRLAARCREAVASQSAAVTLSADLRYRGQSHTVSVSAGSAEAPLSIAQIEAGFHAAHERRFGIQHSDRPVEWVTLRARAEVPAAEVPSPSPTSHEPSSPTARIHWGGVGLDAACLTRSRADGETVLGPAVILQDDTTTFVPPGWVSAPGEAGSLVLSFVGVRNALSAGKFARQES